MSHLYINEQGAVLGFSENCFIITGKNTLKRKLPGELIETISVFGNIQITTQCIRKCLKDGVDLIYYSKNGSYFGRLISTGHVNVDRQRKQMKFTEDEKIRLQMSKRVINAKINNQYVLLKRYARTAKEDISKEINNIAISRKHIELCTSIEQVMGYEGNASREYFKALSRIIVPEFRFNGRSKRPPKDPFNAMISLGYSILLNEIYGVIEGKGLNPYFGFMHKDHTNHPSLASDLIEEWRSVIVDSTVMSLINGHEIFYDNFNENDNGGIILDKEGMGIFINKLEKKMMTMSKYITSENRSVNFRRGIEIQIGRLAKSIDEWEILYEPIKIR